MQRHAEVDADLELNGARGRWLRRALVSGLIATALVLSAVEPAEAITVSVTGTAITSGGNGLTTQDFEYTSSGVLGSGTMHFDFVLIFEDSGLLRTEGTGVLMRSDGATLTGPETSTVDLNQEPFPVVITFEVTGGTGALAGATGEILLTGTSGGPGVVGDVFTMNGTLNIQLPVPTDKDQCKDGGWQQLHDDQGAGFRNQGQCVAFVNHIG